jgi:signal transduction histidine kinase
VKHSNSNKVDIEVRAIEREQSPLLEISISDDGPGIPDEVKPTLFARYLESAKGSGLGMSIVHALVVERFKGEVEILNRVPGDYTRGTTVKIWLPKSET